MVYHNYQVRDKVRTRPISLRNLIAAPVYTFDNERTSSICSLSPGNCANTPLIIFYDGKRLE
ncbi:hypothetical protein I7I53_07625 [Histoplasma capsulatum var. duboisii H88]|uniref:Uncharacterized protein n=1 Tax=Ajellomyces capsulatus (strain H88) TaxID=544711 RepID=A0A8A1LE57_AJEC8|nr:hypothetical protein I7I53_07625 [Histoplasma capsulatum var. duboisii H88]